MRVGISGIHSPGRRVQSTFGVGIVWRGFMPAVAEIVCRLWERNRAGTRPAPTVFWGQGRREQQGGSRHCWLGKLLGKNEHGG